MEKINCSVAVNNDCISASKESIPAFGRAHGCACVGKRGELEPLMVGGG